MSSGHTVRTFRKGSQIIVEIIQGLACLTLALDCTQADAFVQGSTVKASVSLKNTGA